MKKPFQPGDRVRVRDVDQTTGIETIDSGLVKTVNGCAVFVEADTWANPANYKGMMGYWYHERQLIHLRKPKKEKREARTLYIHYDAFALTYSGNDPVSKFIYHSPGPELTPFREVLPSEVPISRESLAAAFTEAFKPISTDGTGFKALCKALGLPGDK